MKHNDDPSGQEYSPAAKSAARRALKNKALAYLAALGDASVTQQVLDRFRAATNMTDKISALAALIDSEGMPALHSLFFACASRVQEACLSPPQGVAFQRMRTVHELAPQLARDNKAATASRGK